MRKIVSLLFCLSALCASAQVSGYSLEQAATLLRQGILRKVFQKLFWRIAKRVCLTMNSIL